VTHGAGPGAAEVRRPAARVPTVSVRLVWAYRSASRALGIDSDEAWRAHGVDPASLTLPDTRVPRRVALDLAKLVVGLSGVDDYALRAAEAVEPGVLDLLEFAVRSQRDIDSALDCLVRLLPLLADGIRLELQRDARGAIATLLLDEDPVGRALTAEFVFAYLTLAGRRFTGRADYCPAEVHLAHPAPRDPSHHQQLFGSKLRFGASANRFVLTNEQLALPFVHADSRLSALLERVGLDWLESVGHAASLADEARRLVVKELPSGRAEAAVVARALGITPRTLHRRLADEGTNFRALVDDTRRGLALGYMDQPGLGLSEISYLLGMSGVQAFHRAFRRWTGQTPGAYRARDAQG